MENSRPLQSLSDDELVKLWEMSSDIDDFSHETIHHICGYSDSLITEEDIKNKNDVQLKRIFGFFCSVIFQFRNLEGSTWPTQEEVAQMQDYTDKIDQALKGDPSHPNALLVARITENGFYQMIWMLNNPHIANEYLNGIVTENRQERDFEYLIEKDLEWNKIDWLLQDFNSK